MRFLLAFLLLLTISLGPVFGQAKTVIQPGEDSFKRHELSCVKFSVDLPRDFVANMKAADEFVFQEKGSVLKFAFIENIARSRFCDSLTPQYFDAQGLSDINVLEEGDVRIYRGKFFINDIPYVRAFCVYALKQSTLICIANYPELIEAELALNFKTIFMNSQDE